MRLAFLSTVRGYPWGGADTMWTRAAEAAALRGDELLLGLSPLTAEHSRIRALVALGARLVLRERTDIPPTRVARMQNRFARQLGLREPIVRALGTFHPELVIVSCGGTYDLIIEPQLHEWLRTTRTPYHVVANFQPEAPELNDADRARALTALTEAREISFVSQRNLDVTRRHLLHALPNARVRHNPLVGAGAPLPWPQTGPLRFATLGRLEAVKGLDLLLHALAAALGRETGWELDIHGTGRDENYLRQIIAHLGLGDRVRLAGFATDLDAVWRTHHLLISPALNEGVPMTIPEALLRGRPVAATAVGGAEDWIEPGCSGFLAPAATVPLLIELLRTAWDARHRWAEMGAYGATRARTHYRPDDYLAVIRPPTGES